MRVFYYLKGNYVNIFILDSNSAKAAEYLCDQHVNKMLLESTQLLCTACHSLEISFPGQYKATHKNHPCSKWLLEESGNPYWLAAHANSMQTEREERFDQYQMHASIPIIALAMNKLERYGGEVTVPKMAMPIACQVNPFPTESNPQTWETVVDSYRAYYKHKQLEWRARGKEMTWTNRPTPFFMK